MNNIPPTREIIYTGDRKNNFFSKSSNILSVAMLLVGLTTFGTGVLIADTNAKDMQKEMQIKNKQIESLEDSLQIERDSLQREREYKQLFMNKVEEQRKQVNELMKKNNDLKKKIVTYKSKGESPMPSRGEQSKRKVHVVATAYTSKCNGCSGITATGVNVKNTTTHKGAIVIATDPSVIPLHSLVRVDTETGDSFYAIAEDKGGAIKGGKIDVLVSNYSKAVAFGRQSATLTILREGES